MRYYVETKDGREPQLTADQAIVWAAEMRRHGDEAVAMCERWRDGKWRSESLEQHD